MGCDVQIYGQTSSRDYYSFTRQREDWAKMQEATRLSLVCPTKAAIFDSILVEMTVHCHRNCGSVRVPGLSTVLH